jgi:hypothetical protein
VWVLTTPLWWNRCNSSFKNLQERLLNTFTRYVSSDGWILRLARNLIDVIDVNNLIELNRFFKNRYVFIASTATDIILNGKQVIQNDGYFQIRYRDNDSRKISDETYAQYQWNGLLGMDYRKVVGSNARFRLREKAHSDFYLGIGAFYEMEKWNWSGVTEALVSSNATPIQRNIIRFNQYVKYAVQLNDSVDISTISYLQFPVNSHFQNPRWYFDINTHIKISKKSSFSIHWDQTYDHNRVVPVSTFIYSMNYGFQLTI